MDALEVDEHVPDARGAHGECGSQENGIVRSAHQLGEAPRDVDVSGRQHAGVVELEQQPGRAPREACVEALGDVRHALSPRSRTSLSASTSAARRLPREHAARGAVDHGRVRPGHPAHEQVQDAGEVALGGVARQSPAQVAVQRDGVQQRLESVVGVRHLGAQRGWPVVPGGELLAGRREPVRLVVDDGEALPANAHDEIDAAGEVAPDARTEPRIEEAFGVARQGVVGDSVRRRTSAIAASVSAAPLGSSPPTSGSSKFNSSSRSPRTMSQGGTAGNWPQGCLDRGAEPRHHRVDVTELDPTPRLGGRDLKEQRDSRSAAAKSTASKTRCTSVPTSVPTDISASSDGTARSASRPSSATGGACGPDSSSTSGSSGSLATCGS